MTLEDQIGALEDATAVGMLQRFAGAQPRRDVPAVVDVAVADQLREEVGLPAEAPARPSAGALARAALLVIASDPQHRSGIQAMLDYPAGEKFAVVETALLVSAVLIALQTHVQFERDKHGKWTVMVKKTPTDSSLLKDLVKKLISFG